MPTLVNPTCFHLSASAIAAFKACPTRFRLGYREGIRLAQDTESQRVGTNWHALHEQYEIAEQAELAKALIEEGDNEHERAEFIRQERKTVALQAAIDHLNKRYATAPTGFDLQAWRLERDMLATAFFGYLWYYQEDVIETLATELPFDLPLHAPRTGLPLRIEEVLRVGKIDRLILWQNMVGNVERKSTTRSIDPDSDYWERVQKDTQISMYALAMRDLKAGGLLDAYPIPADARFGNTLYDVYRRPLIKPSMLSQKETAEFLATGTYYEQQFEVATQATGKVEVDGKEIEGVAIQVNGDPAEVEIGKSGRPAIRETIPMFCARFLQDIYARPAHYFVRREVPRTDADLRKFRKELFNIYQAMRTFDATGNWFENENQCRATFNCAYIPICYGPGADSVCGSNDTPKGFRRVFLTREGQSLEGE